MPLTNDIEQIAIQWAFVRNKMGLFDSCFLFSKKMTIKKMGRIYLVLNFFFFFVMKSIKNIENIKNNF